MKTCCITLLFFMLHSLLAQTIITGKITTVSGIPISGANIYIEGSYDGATSDTEGGFEFKTNNTNTQTLVIAYIAYQTEYLQLDVSKMKSLKIVLKRDSSTLDEVVLTAGSLDASNGKSAVLTPMDIATTAGALADTFGALQTLPGTSKNTNDGRLFVRGGDAGETQVFIDGLRVFKPFLATGNQTPTRGRNSPFLFKGVNFSTGGYSAEYGQALSSVLDLNTIDEPEQDEVNLQFMSVGGGAAATKKWEKSSLSFNATYFNLKPYQEIIKQRIAFTKPFELFSGEAVFRRKFKKGLFKSYAALSYSNLGVIQDDINVPTGSPFSLKNSNFYFNNSYKGDLSSTWKIQTGLSVSSDNSEIGVPDVDIKNDEKAIHGKLKFQKKFSNHLKLNFGAEQFVTNFNEDLQVLDTPDTINKEFNNNLSAAFTEGEFIISSNFAAKLGMRFSYSELLSKSALSPRVSLAFKLSPKGQLAFAYGDFYQNPSNSILKETQNLDPEQSSHLLLNYLYKKDKQTFRAEVYRKEYSNLVKHDSFRPEESTLFSNTGNGYAQGLDLFWRDGNSIKNLEYWASYSYLDTERNFKNYPIAAQPDFATKHNFSLVTKYWIEDWRTQLGVSYSFGSGRTFTNPNKTGFLNEKTKSFHDLSLNFAYLITQQKILFVSVSNLLNIDNVFGYQYADTPNANGVFNRRAIQQPANQFFFVGFFWTISKDKSKNQLENL